ncbi:butyrate kinase [Bacillus sp. B1-b2]|uniref:butyrate kinase n=1 Tax=Bacillus sp. B1-b2 TaxID=2653201 RepID=UPI0012624EA9|nr:butyrate kinase [Bacillus sp. B1-b2]KAB7669961.1 butyrate kinase [Bacillus sp. B1-b2]
MKKFRILTINPRVTTTEVALYENEVPLLEYVIAHTSDELTKHAIISAQYVLRANHILAFLVEKGINLSKIQAVCGRGGLLKPIDGGTYSVNSIMVKELLEQSRGEHPSNLGALIAFEIATHLDISAYIVDPVVVDEMEDLARITGYPGIDRKSVFHALNHKACGRRAALELGKKYEDINLIVAHMGSGITIGAHSKGKVIDVNNGFNGEGPFSLERSGTIPPGDLIDLCYSGQFTYEEMKHQLLFHSGLKAYMANSDMTSIESLLPKETDSNILYLKALAYQVAKEIGSASTVLYGKVDGIILTGELAFSHLFVNLIMERVDWIADIMVYPGEDELQSLTNGCLRVMRKEEEAKEYI